MLAGEIRKRGKASARPVCQTLQMPFPEYVDSADPQGRGQSVAGILFPDRRELFFFSQSQ